MVDVNLIFIIAFGLTVCYGAGLSYRQIRERKAEVSQSTYRKKVISLCLGAAAVLVWFSLWFLYLHYDETRPTTADESSGRIYSLSNHDHVVFLTLMERWYLFLLGIIAFVLFLCGYVLGQRVRKSLVEPEQDGTCQ